MAWEKTYIAIDLKSFYASVECQERALDPLNANLVVADASRTDKTICLAVSPSLKAYGIPGRARLFEVVQKVREINAMRLRKAPGHKFTGESYLADELAAHPEYALTYITATPRMAYYLDYSSHIYEMYTQFISPEDIHVYSVDEVFIDATPYLKTYRLTARELTMKLIQEVLLTTGITATAGIGTNLFLCKAAMDIVAKHIPADKDGVRIAELDEASFRRELWCHRPLTDFWRVGRGISRKLEANGMYTMGDVARRSVKDEDSLYRLFGINAELLIDHAWGWEPVTIKDIKAYRPEKNSLSAGQVLPRAYDYAGGKLIAREMADQLSLSLMEKGLTADKISLTVGYDTQNLTDPARAAAYTGSVRMDHYGRAVPVHGHGTQVLPRRTNLSKAFVEAALAIYERCVNPDLLVRRLNIAAENVQPEGEGKAVPQQLDLFADDGAAEKRYEKEKRLQEAVVVIRQRYGKNSLLKGMNLEEGATAVARNGQIGGHKA